MWMNHLESIDWVLLIKEDSFNIWYNKAIKESIPKAGLNAYTCQNRF